jgi:5-methylcytosine-specific restriction endonuclease McrA
VAEYDSTDPRELRRAIRKRDRGVCRACGLDTNALRREIRGRGRSARLRELGFLPRRSLWELDHVVPLIDGGGHEPSNLQTLCVPCHRKKSADETRARARGRDVETPCAETPRAETQRVEVSGLKIEGEPAGREDRSLDELLARADAVNARAEELLDRS